ncbi:glycoside hydrolase family 95 protein [Coniophora puteana RWD-64-598 SS2]|uniref:Glycoside hydrolase family 95 protein n=1 Tax=Coniophora puteana (strain RWD-64-598) TaxID=741705 RepID=A0A5M3MA46_CONPW|nr:glycoside hydrolase family 95 protein [Coniophora puteana RWD-64-598 SS2]EIW76069.1 glycoside hydrolase family 95 protein [Coniophora puteana RWD-64-598 SS2]
MITTIQALVSSLWAYFLSVFFGVLPSSMQLLMRRIVHALTVTTVISVVSSAPPGFPASGNGLWYTSPGTIWAQELLPIGNGYLAAMLPGGIQQESTQLNLESLWSGGLFQDPSYNGGNSPASDQEQLAQDMQSIRQQIFASPNGTINNIEEIMSPIVAYGGYGGAGYLLATLNTSSSTPSSYYRWLDLDEAVQRTLWTQDGETYTRESFCSHPLQACVQYQNTTGSSLPSLTYAYSVAAEAGIPTPNVTCMDNATLSIRNYISSPGMLYEIIARVEAPGGTSSCTVVSSNPTNATLTVTGAKEAYITWVGGTDYDISAGTAASNFSFQGPDPHSALVSILSSDNLQSSSYETLLAQHIADYQSIMSPFSLSLGQTADLSTPTDQLVASYQTYVGDPYLEWLTFNFGRYLLAGSARGILPANLQGKWGQLTENAWGADSNINIQMNYWFAEMTNLNVTQSLWNYFEDTWAPRGAETAQILYNISQGWVTHDEIFGYTGMKLDGNSAQWADYPESNAWMMIHVWDHFDYTGDVAWWKAQGWPLLKGVASFHLEKLIEDLHYNDGTLVTAPCNSPEQAPITFGCAHAQQLIWQLFNAIEKGYAAAGDDDTEFLDSIQEKRQSMDKGLRIGWWGQLQEWKVDMDQPNDTHRHLSHLIGLYPGYAIASYDQAIQGGLTVNGTSLNYTKQQVLDAAGISLLHRGNGTGPDADSGWEKVWRAACWAQLGNATEFYKELTYTIDENWGSNLFDLYYPNSTTFQIDANFGFPAALLNSILQAPDVASYDIPLQVNLLPALPSAWPSGSITGARIRGGITLDLEWSNSKPTSAKFTVDSDVSGRERNVVVNFGGQTVGSFATSSGLTKTLTF